MKQETKIAKSKDPQEVFEWFGDVFDNYEPSASYDETISRRELLSQFPQIEERKFDRYQHAGTMRRARQRVRTEMGGWWIRYREEVAIDTMRRIAEMDGWSKYQMMAEIIYLQDKIRKMNERGLKEIHVDQ